MTPKKRLSVEKEEKAEKEKNTVCSHLSATNKNSKIKTACVLVGLIDVVRRPNYIYYS